MDIVCGIYEIKNRINSHRYIGSSKNVYHRWGLHRSGLRNGKHHSDYLQNAWDKYGEDAFEFNILLICKENELIKNEQDLINSEEPEYNIAICAEASGRGLKRSKKTREKMSRAKTGANNPNYGRSASEETRKKMSMVRKGVPKSDQHKRKISEGLMGHVLTTETKMKKSIAMKKYYAEQRKSKEQRERLF